MKLRLDTSKAYAIALEGGGAKGAYEVGVWRALDEAGVRFDAVAGTSVGALNGAMMVMGELEQALRLWENIRFSQVFDADDVQLKKLYDHKLSEVDFRTLFKDVMEAIHEGGLDIEPLRRLIAEWVDEEKIRSSPKKLFLVTYSLTDKRELDIDADELEEGKLRDMLLASAYVPLFQRKKLDGKDYVDGSVHNIVPISSLLERGYRDIIVIRIFGVGFEKRTRIPEDANIITVAPRERLGGVLQFDAAQSRRLLQLGYFDGLRMLYGLAGEKYYIDRQWSETEAYFALQELCRLFIKEETPSLREMNETILPKLAKHLKVKDGGYYDLLTALLERLAERQGISPFRVRTEKMLLTEIARGRQSRP